VDENFDLYYRTKTEVSIGCAFVTLTKQKMPKKKTYTDPAGFNTPLWVHDQFKGSSACVSHHFCSALLPDNISVVTFILYS